MIEAVSSVVLNAPLLKGNAEQASTSQIEAVQAELSSGVSEFPRAPFISPVVYVDTNFDTAVLQIRDSDTGDVLRQFPSESTLEARNRAEATRQFQELSVSRAAPEPQTQENSTPEVNTEPTSAPSAPVRPDTAIQAQIASQALSAGAQTSQIQAATVAISA